MASNLKQLLFELGLEKEYQSFDSAGLSGVDLKQDELFGRLLLAVRTKCGVSSQAQVPPMLPDSANMKEEAKNENRELTARDHFVEQIITNVGLTPEEIASPKAAAVVKKPKKKTVKGKGGGGSSLKQLMAEKRRQKEEMMKDSSSTDTCFIAVDPAMMIDSLVEVNHVELESLYDVQEAIARGNFGVVHIGKMKNPPPLSQDSILDNDEEAQGGEVGLVAIKKLKKMSHANVCAVAREAKVMKRLAGHPGLVQLLDVFEDDTTINLVLEFVAGGDLLHAITLHKSYNETHARDMCLQLISALEFMHDHSVVHLDLKPDNLMCTSFSPTQETLTLKVTDFGVSKILSDENEKVFRMVGTPKYSGPEVHASNDAVQGTSLDGIISEGDSAAHDSRASYYGKPADVWSLGAIVYCLLTGSGPYDAVPAAELKEKMTSGTITYDRHAWAPVSSNALQCVQSLCHVDPKERPTMSEAKTIIPWFVEDMGEGNDFPDSSYLSPQRSISEVSNDQGEMVFKPLNKCVMGLRSSIARRKQSKLLVEALLNQPVEQYVVGDDIVGEGGDGDWPTSLPMPPPPPSTLSSSSSFLLNAALSPRVQGITIRTIETPLEDSPTAHESYLNNLKQTNPKHFALEVWNIAQDFALHEIKKFTEEDSFHSIHSLDESKPELNFDLEN